MKYFFAKVSRKLGLSKRLNFSVRRSINGKVVIIPVISGLGEGNLSIPELWMCTLIKKALSIKKGVFIDIGVNIGQTLIKLRTVDDTIEYIGFEPNPICIYYVLELIKANQYANTTLIPAGIFSKTGILELNLFSEGDTDSAASVIHNFRPGEKVYKKIFVPVTRFEDVRVLINDSSIAIVKIDVEGAELEVLQSLEEILQNTRPFIFVEILPCYTDQNAVRISRQLQLEELLTRLKYSIFRIIKKDNNSVKELQALDSIGIHADMELCEYIMSPQESGAHVSAFFK